MNLMVKKSIKEIRDHYLKTVVENNSQLNKRMGIESDCEIYVNKPVNIQHKIENGTD